jgi:polysaccharide biosynthesis/export protein
LANPAVLKRRGFAVGEACFDDELLSEYTNMRNQSPLAIWLRPIVRAFVPSIALCLIAFTNTAAQGQQTKNTLVRPKTVTTRLPVTAPTPTRSNHAPAAPENNRYRIGPGDVLEVRVYKLPDLSRDALRVEESGTIRMPLINEDIQAACRTEGELAKDIAKRYLTMMRNPQVDVFIKEYQSRPVAVIGAVNTPGRFQLQRRIRLLDLLSFAGGPAERAGGNIQVVHSNIYPPCETTPNDRKREPETLGLSVFKLADTLAGDAQANPYVRAGDVITVLEFEQVYVIGNVVHPSAFPLKEKIMLSQAIAMAGGTLPDSQNERVRLLRQKTDGTKQEFIVDLKAINKQRAPDVVLKPNDIVEVPTASGRRFLRNLLEGAVPSVARFPVRVIR